MKKPIFLFDAQCGLCTYWVAYWRQLTRGRVEFQSIQEHRKSYPNISDAAFDRSAQFVVGVEVFEGARGVVEMLAYARGKKWVKYMYDYVPFANKGMELMYKKTASCKDCSASMSRMFWGDHPKPACLEWVWMYRILFTLMLVDVFTMRIASQPSALLIHIELVFALALFAPRRIRLAALAVVVLLELTQTYLGYPADKVMLIFASMLLLLEQRNPRTSQDA